MERESGYNRRKGSPLDFSQIYFGLKPTKTHFTKSLPNKTRFSPTQRRKFNQFSWIDTKTLTKENTNKFKLNQGQNYFSKNSQFMFQPMSLLNPNRNKLKGRSEPLIKLRPQKQRFSLHANARGLFKKKEIPDSLDPVLENDNYWDFYDNLVKLDYTKGFEKQTVTTQSAETVSKKSFRPLKSRINMQKIISDSDL